MILCLKPKVVWNYVFVYVGLLLSSWYIVAKVELITLGKWGLCLGSRIWLLL